MWLQLSEWNSGRDQLRPTETASAIAKPHTHTHNEAIFDRIGGEVLHWTLKRRQLKAD